METIHITANTTDAAHIKAIKSFFKAIKVDYTLRKEKKSPYNEEFVKKILARSKNARQGNVVVYDNNLRKELFGVYEI